MVNSLRVSAIIRNYILYSYIYTLDSECSKKFIGFTKTCFYFSYVCLLTFLLEIMLQSKNKRYFCSILNVLYIEDLY